MTTAAIYARKSNEQKGRAEADKSVTRQIENARAFAEKKGWRWVGEMEEIAATFEANGLPGGFHHAAAEVFRR